jgi:hypothetical protein
LSGPFPAKLVRTPINLRLRHAPRNKMILDRLLKQGHQRESFVAESSYSLDQCDSGGLGIQDSSIFVSTAMDEPISLINELFQARN